MYKKILAWVLILSGVYGVALTFWSGDVLRAYGYYAPVQTWVTSALWIAVGVGLLRLQRWARWLALGYCALSVLGAVLLVPVMLFFAGGLKALEGAVPVGKLPGFLEGIPGMIVLVAAWTVAMGVLAFIVLREIRSEVGLLEFGEQEKAKQPPEPFWNVIVSAIAWIAVSVILPDDVRLASRHAPPKSANADFREAAAGAPEEPGDTTRPGEPRISQKEAMRLNAMTQMVGRGDLTADGEHVVFLSNAVDDVYVLRLIEGDLLRTQRHAYPLGEYPQIDAMVSADASVVLYPDGTLQSLTGGREKKLQSFNSSLGSESLGFVDASRVLAFQAKGIFQLIDTAADRVIWTANVGPASGKWENRVKTWSPTRAWLAWSGGGDSVSLLNLESGQVRELSSGVGGGATLHFSANERSLLVQNITAGGESSMAGPPNTVIFDLASGEKTALRIPGLALNNGGAEGALLAFNLNSRVLSFLPTANDPSGAWQAQFPPGVNIATVGPSGLLLASQYDANSGSGTLMYTLGIKQPRDNGKFIFRPIHAEPGRQRRWLRLRGDRNVVVTEGTRVQVYELWRIKTGAPSMRSIDLMTERKLSDGTVFEELPEVLTVDWARAPSSAPEQSTAATAVEAAPAARAASSIPTAGRQGVSPERADEPNPADKPDPNAIVKCRDASGALSFTRGFCPPGSTVVGAPGTKN